MSALPGSSRVSVLICLFLTAAASLTVGPAMATADGIGPPFQIGQVAGTSWQFDPSVAFDGTNYMVVWTDDRGGTRDIYGARVTQSGTVLDPLGFPVAVAPNQQRQAVIGFDGTDYMVVWQDSRDGGTENIYGARVTPSGTVLDPSGFIISSNPALSLAVHLAIAFDGTNYMVVWTDWSTWGASGGEVYCARVTTSGTVLDPLGILVAGGNVSRFSPSVAFDGTNYMIVWGNASAGLIYGARVTTAGVVLDPSGIPITTVDISLGRPDIAFDGTDYMAVWEDGWSGHWGGDIYAARITTAGTVLDASGILVSAAPEGQRESKIAFDGSNYRVVWNTGCQESCEDIYAARVTPAGTVLDPTSIPVTTAPNIQGYPEIVAGPPGDLLVVYATKESGYWRIWGNFWGTGLVSISGVKFDDANGNGTRQGGEPGLPGWTIQLNPGARATLTNENGEYFFPFLDPCVYTVNEVPRDNWEQTCPAGASYVLDLTSGVSASGIDFGNRALVDVQDLSVSVGGARARPGFEKRYGITYENKGTKASNATVTLDLPPEVAHLESSPGGTYSSGKQQVKWSLGSLAPGSLGWLWTRVQVPATVPLGTILTSTAEISSTGGDIDLGNNSSTESQLVRGAYDPNDKEVTPKGWLLRTDKLEYQVNFQNVGTDTALSIVVRDTLDINLDLATVVNGASLHPCVFQIIGRELSWTFPNIQLPDSNTNEPGSHGFVTFEVLPPPGVLVGTEIENRAAVYFDFNAPVMTNTVSNTIVQALPAEVDLDPNTLSLRSQGNYISCYIEPPDGYHASAIDVGTVLFNGLLPALDAPTSVADHDSDGVADMMVKFSRAAVVSILGGGEGPKLWGGGRADGAPFVNGEEFQVSISGYMSDGRTFAALDSIRVIDPPPDHENATVALQIVPRLVLGSARICFELGVGGPVNLRVYDVAGRLVRTIVDAPKVAGRHELTWDGKAENGKRVGAGVYFVRIELRGKSKVEKVLVLR